MKLSSPTSYPRVNEVLDILHMNVKEILNDQFIGMYLYGSLANGGFDEHSDIDVIIVTTEEISADTFSALHRFHKWINEIDSPWATQIEVSYMPQVALRRFDPTNKLHPHLDRGDNEVLHMMSHESDWIVQRHVLRERGIVIDGPELQRLIDPVSRDDLRRAIAGVLPLWTQPILEDPSQIHKRGYQSYCVLTLCRMLYTLKQGDITSKPAAVKWALENADQRWSPLIERALLGRQTPNLEADSEDINETLSMMQYVLSQTKPTPYLEVNEVLKLLLGNVKRILGDRFVGMYLYGSLSSGDFDSQTSDIDFLVVTDGLLLQETITELEAMHKETWATSLKRAGELEGAYVPKELIRCHDPNGAPCPTVNEGQFYVAPLGSDWIIQRHVVREYGVIVEGPDAKTLIDFVSPQEIRTSVLGVLDEWWFPMLDDPSWLRGHGNAYPAFAVITMCRVLHVLEHGTVTSKPKAIQWARQVLQPSWLPLIDKAVAASRHETQEDFVEEALDFIQLVRVQTINVEKLDTAKGNS
ncbi:MAG TPA: aminoglycoside adenylyltransferase domain-containing protein [Anaerolineales bacterium]|nr:aminoglycoside adenylyltransferase domain-containing protein [Anaerolineales bacterium]